MRCSWCQQQFTREMSFREFLFPFLIPAAEKCGRCFEKLEFIDPHASCAYCCHKNKACSDCDYWHQRYPDFRLKHRALLSYNQGMQDWLHQYKLMGDYRLRETFVPEIKRELSEQTYDLVIPIPLSLERFQQRGFNQVEGILQAAGIDYQPILTKKRHLPPQAELSRQERLASPQPFVIESKQVQLKDKTLLLVDDVYTTGQTLHHAAEVLLRHHPRKVTSFSLVR
jgi:competence protein ComFC